MTQDQLAALACARNEAVNNAASAYNLATATARADRELSKTGADRAYEEIVRQADIRRRQAHTHADAAFAAATVTQREAYDAACLAAERAYGAAVAMEGGQ